MKLSRSFFNIYIIIIGSFILISWLMDEVWQSYVEQDIESYTGYKFMLVAIGDYLHNHPEEEWLTIVDKTSNKFNLPIRIIPLAEANLSLKNHKQESSLTSETYVTYKNENVQLFQLLKNTEKVLTLGPTKMPTRPRLETSIRIGLLAVLGLFILFWLWPISKDLDGLRRSAEELGKGNFDTQSPLAKSTMTTSLVQTFNMMSKRVKRLIDAHKELTNAVAHELRTPLARSKFALQMLESVNDEEKKLKYRTQIANDVNELESLINEMLIYASFDSDKPKLDIKPVDLVQVIEQHLNKQTSYSGKIVFTHEMVNTPVNCDQHFIERAFTNYLTNAQKYGHDEIIINLTLENNQCLLSVADNGEGINEQNKSTIFDAFTRGDESRNKEVKGFGLGLAIVSRIMEWHQGRAWVEDSQSGGACFYLQWPQ